MNVSQNFTYTADRQAFLSVAGVFVGLTLIEGAVFGLVIALFVPSPYKFVLIGLLVALFIFLLVKMFSELWTSHSLTEHELRLRYGLDLSANIPRTMIVAAKPMSEGEKKVKSTLMDFGVRYEEDNDRLVATFSKKGQVLLTLDRRYPFRFGLQRRAQTDKILINVDHRSDFLTALAVPTASEKQASIVKEG